MAAHTAQKAATEIKNEVQQQLEAITKFINGYQNDGVNWGHVGSLGFVKRQLNEICNHFNIKLPE